MAETRLLVLGYGNPGRADDGLGPAAARAVATWSLSGVQTEETYQLTIEDADLLTRYDDVVFVDATVDASEPFSFVPLPAREWTHASFTTHAVDPATVLGLAREVLGASTRGWRLAIRGHRFGCFGEGLSEAASTDLETALCFLRGWIAHGRPDIASGKPNPPTGLQERSDRAQHHSREGARP